jgi:hypothetical protein
VIWPRLPASANALQIFSIVDALLTFHAHFLSQLEVTSSSLSK